MNKSNVDLFDYKEALDVLEVSHVSSSAEVKLNYAIFTELLKERSDPVEREKRRKRLDSALKTIITARLEMAKMYNRNTKDDYCVDYSSLDEDHLEHSIVSHLVASDNAAELICKEEKLKMARGKTKKKVKKAKKKGKQKNVNEDEGESDEAYEESVDVQKSDCEEEELDINSAFIANATRKDEKIGQSLGRSKDDNKNNKLINVLKSKGVQGFKLVEEERFVEAAQVYTDAIRLQPNTFAFYGNRSYCYERMGKYELALADASKALSLNCKCSISHFRKGCALIGLKDYSMAEAAFLEVLKLDPKCSEAREELTRVMKLKLMEMGFPERKSERAASRYSSLEDAISAITTEPDNENDDDSDSMSETYVSDNEDGFFAMLKFVNDPEEINPCNPHGLKSLWIGELDPQVTEKKLRECFGRYGEIEQVTLKADHDRQFAFINFKEKASAGRAMLALQGYPLFGRHILVKFPLKRLFGDAAADVKALKPKPREVPASAAATSAERPQPINGDECYFWRTRGKCYHENKCRYRHVERHKGIGP